jgi:L-ascorbate metabolism protein UlaG (beta-lactamase superfamily)
MSTTTSVTYIGGPTVLLEYAGLRIVTDPTFDAPQHYAADDDTSGLTKTAGPGIERADLGRVDLVLLSHSGHEDNLDYEGLELLATGVRTYSTRKAAMDLFGGNVVGLDAWETDAFEGVIITAVPALHGPPGSERLLGPVTGFVLEFDDAPTVYVSGDNASLPLVEQIAERFPHIELAILHAGAAQYPPLPGPLTLSSVDAAAAARILGASTVVGVHTEDWAHFSEDRAALEAAFGGAPLLATPRGQRVQL